jgi:hypothetical protein
MSQPRKYIPYSERLAAALACLLPKTVRDTLRGYEDKVPAAYVISLFQFDHIRLHAIERDDPDVDKWFNLDPLLTKSHREKSNVDNTRIAKVKRLEREHVAFRERILTREPKPPPKHKWPKRKLRSRGFRS